MRVVVIIGGPALLIAAAVVVVTALRNRQQSAPPPDVPVSASSAEVRVKAVERKAGPVAEGEEAAASGAVAIVCGADKATAGRYGARNDALRSIARRRDLSEKENMVPDPTTPLILLGFAGPDPKNLRSNVWLEGKCGA